MLLMIIDTLVECAKIDFVGAGLVPAHYLVGGFAESVACLKLAKVLVNKKIFSVSVRFGHS